MKRKDFMEATKSQFNSVRRVGAYNISCTGWKYNDKWQITESEDFKVTCERTYEAIASFHTREELWQYIKSLQS